MEREGGFLAFFNNNCAQLYHEYLIFSVSPGDDGQPGGRTGDDDDDHLWEWWHTMLIACIAVVVVLGIVVVILIAVSYREYY